MKDELKSAHISILEIFTCELYIKETLLISLIQKTNMSNIFIYVIILSLLENHKHLFSAIPIPSQRNPKDL